MLLKWGDGSINNITVTGVEDLKSVNTPKHYFVGIRNFFGNGKIYAVSMRLITLTSWLPFYV